MRNLSVDRPAPPRDLEVLLRNLRLKTKVIVVHPLDCAGDVGVELFHGDNYHVVGLVARLLLVKGKHILMGRIKP